MPEIQDALGIPAIKVSQIVDVYGTSVFKSCRRCDAPIECSGTDQRVKCEKCTTKMRVDRLKTGITCSITYEGSDNEEVDVKISKSAMTKILDKGGIANNPTEVYQKLSFRSQ